MRSSGLCFSAGQRNHLWQLVAFQFSIFCLAYRSIPRCFSKL